MSTPIASYRFQSFVSQGGFTLHSAGEGAGYAGGITSAAVDGVKLVEAILEKWRKSS